MKRTAHIHRTSQPFERSLVVPSVTTSTGSLKSMLMLGHLAWNEAQFQQEEVAALLHEFTEDLDTDQRPYLIKCLLSIVSTYRKCAAAVLEFQATACHITVADCHHTAEYVRIRALADIYGEYSFTLSGVADLIDSHIKDPLGGDDRHSFCEPVLLRLHDCDMYRMIATPQNQNWLVRQLKCK